MKLNDKRFRQGLKTNYYPSFFHAMMDSFRFSVLWTAVITVLLCIIPLIIYLRNVESLSLSIISVGLSFLFVVFIISNAIFLYENWYKQNRTLNKMKRLLPEGCDILSIEYKRSSPASSPHPSSAPCALSSSVRSGRGPAARNCCNRQFQMP